jgi:hypothetical protein
MTAPELCYVVGTGRSGSTLVGTILGEYPGVFCAGELRFLWERGFLENRFCGCGERFSDCPLWTAVVERAGITTDPARLAAVCDRVVRMRRIGTWLTGRGAEDPAVVDLGEHYRRVHAAIAVETGCRVVVDTSKSPAFALVLESVGIRPESYLHLVRDPRAAAWSWSRSTPSHAPAGDTEPMDRFPPAKSAALWLFWNTVARRRLDARDRTCVARYEDFAARPRTEIERIARALRIGEGSPPCFDDESSVRLSGNHTVAGNPGRRRSGATTIVADDEWRRSMPTPARTAVTAITLPLLHHAGYRLGGGPPAPSAAPLEVTG